MPRPRPATVVLDTSCLLCLLHLDLLPKLILRYSAVYLPIHLLHEARRRGKSRYPLKSVLKSYPFLKRCKVGDEHEARLLYDPHLEPDIPIHQGEAEVIIQARERQAAEVIIDDSDGREVATRHSLNVRGTVRLLIELRRAEIIRQEIRPLVEKCRTDLGFRISDDVLDQILKEIGE